MGNYLMNPLRNLSQLQRAVDRLFENVVVPSEKLNQTPAFNPNCEITEDEKQYLVRFDLPGIPKDQIKIELDDNRLTVSGERKEEKKEESKKRHVSEMYYGSFLRSFTLPTPVDPERVAATYDSGVLSIALAKADGKASRRIMVK